MTAGASADAMPWEAFTALCSRWAAAYGVPLVLLLVTGIHESERRVNPPQSKAPGDIARGGAWGLFQVTMKTARGLFERPALAKARASWNGTGEGLTDPELNAQLAAYLLSRLWRLFNGDFVATVAAYNGGGGTVIDAQARAQQSGKTLLEELPRAVRAYAQKSIAIRDGLAERIVA